MSHVSPIPLKVLLHGTPGESNPANILRILRKKPLQAWRAVELAKFMKVDQHTLGAALRRLHARGLVDKKDAYWFALSAEDAAHLRTAMMLTRELNERYGPEDPDEWPSLPMP